MANIVHTGVFSRQIFGSVSREKPSTARVAQDFAAIFGRMIARVMIRASSDPNDGFLGIGNGAAGDIYSSFLEAQLGKVLAGSKSMKPLVDASARQLEFRRSYTPPDVIAVSHTDPLPFRPAAASSLAGTTGWDSLGPVLLPMPAAAYGNLEPLPPPDVKE